VRRGLQLTQARDRVFRRCEATRDKWLRQGVWTIRELTLTFANVQNVHVLQGPVERIFGFSNVMLETAGGGSGQNEQRLVDPHRAVLRGIENPAEVRDLILNLLRRYKTAGLGDRKTRLPITRRAAVADPLSQPSCSARFAMPRECSGRTSRNPMDSFPLCRATQSGPSS
jgi:hypothetical protein